MPQRTKKEHKCSHHTARSSRWHDFHFSGKVIVCSVILGFMLILIGGILMAIGMDRDEGTKPEKSDKYDDLQKKPPMVYVGPTIMGIGGFALIVGVLMCLIETKVCRKRNPDASPLINGEGAQTEIKDGDDTVRESDPTAVPSTSHHHHHKHGAHKKSPSGRNPKSKKSHSSNPNKSATQISPSSDEGASSSKNFLTASDQFLTPPNSFVDDVPGLPQLSKKENQATTSLMQSFTSSGRSWNQSSTEFQTPPASFIDDPMSLKFIDRKEEQNANHKFLTPHNSNAGILEEKQIQMHGGQMQDEINQTSSINRNHEFLTPQNSDAGILDEKQIEKHGAKNHPNESRATQENIPVKVNSPEVSNPVHTTGDSVQTATQRNLDLLSQESSTTIEIETMQENQSSLNSIQVKTNEKALLNDVTKSSTASWEGSENSVMGSTHGSDDQVNKSIDEIAHDNIKNESTSSSSEVHSIEISDRETGNSGDLHEDPSQPTSMGSDSNNKDSEEIASEIATAVNDTDASSDTVDTFT